MRRLILLLLATLPLLAARGQTAPDADGYDAGAADSADDVYYVTGAANVPQFGVTVNMPDGFVFVDADDCRKASYVHKILADNPYFMGIIYPGNSNGITDEKGWILRYHPCGHVTGFDINDDGWTQILDCMASAHKDEYQETRYAWPPSSSEANHTLHIPLVYKRDGANFFTDDNVVFGKKGAVILSAQGFLPDSPWFRYYDDLIARAVSFTPTYAYDAYVEGLTQCPTCTVLDLFRNPEGLHNDGEAIDDGADSDHGRGFTPLGWLYRIAGLLVLLALAVFVILRLRR